jgi:small redox-active disulfide protein 2
MDIKILGTGCAKCSQVEKTTKEVINELGIDAKVEELKDIKKIMEYNVLITPGIVINGEVVSSGHVPSKADIAKFIMNALSEEEHSDK